MAPLTEEERREGGREEGREEAENKRGKDVEEGIGVVGRAPPPLPPSLPPSLTTMLAFSRWFPFSS